MITFSHQGLFAVLTIPFIQLPTSLSAKQRGRVVINGYEGLNKLN
jgi:hypothetical protein